MKKNLKSSSQDSEKNSAALATLGVSKAQVLSPVDQRLFDRAIEIFEDDATQSLYQHTVLCQTYLPYREPKVREWVRKNGKISLHIQAGAIYQPRTETWHQVGLPFGPKARLLLAHLNTRALRAGSREIPIEEGSFTAFVRSMQNPLRDSPVAPNGRELRAYREQLLRWSAAKVTLATAISPTRSLQQNREIIDTASVTLQTDENDRQTLLWPDTIRLTEEYWQSLQNHAVPLDARALAALSHNALALDVYHWLAQRLCRIPAGEKVVLPRAALYDQFGQGYGRLRDFWRVFEDVLRSVLTQYPRAKVFTSKEGFHMSRSQPPIASRLFVVPEMPVLPRAAKG